MQNPHDKLLANAAKQVLGPLGFRRKGRSRTWVEDHGWWLTVVEFQPSSWVKGSFLNVAAHWLWSANGYVTFDYSSSEYGIRVEPFIEYETDAQFRTEAMRLARSAAQEAGLLRQTLESVAAVANALVAQERKLPDQAKGSWSAYHAGIALGLSGKMADATAMFLSVNDERVLPNAVRACAQLDDHHQFWREIDQLVAAQRETLGLGPNMSAIC
jgi:hypothetical protein